MDEERVLNALRRVYDPEIGLNVVDLGLVYGVTMDGEILQVDMTMTTPACPLHTLILNQAHAVLSDTFSQVNFIHVNLVWDPPWSPERMTSVARQMLGWTS